jgi:hypothetical protein
LVIVGCLPDDQHGPERLSKGHSPAGDHAPIRPHCACFSRDPLCNPILSYVPRFHGRTHQIDRETREQQGIGLGLPLAKQIIEVHSGTFEINSVVDRGTQITNGLPILEA